MMETIVAVFLLAGGLLFGLQGIITSKRSSMISERTEVGLRIADRELELLRRIDYEQLAMTGALQETLPVDDRHNVVAGDFEWREDEPRESPPTGSASPQVNPSTAFTVGTGGSAVSGTIYRYVTARVEPCDDPALCAGDVTTKRLTVGVVVDGAVAGTPPLRPIWVSSIVAPKSSSSATCCD